MSDRADRRTRAAGPEGSAESGQAEALFDELVRGFAGDAAVTAPAATGGGKFGSSALKVGGKIFAMLAQGELVVKLPAARVDQLLELGTGHRFDPGHGRLMKEWLTVAPADGRLWPDLAGEARAYVGGGTGRR